jgi:hypothetical protein
MLFAAYAGGAILLSAIGSNTYREVTAVMQENYNTRTGVLYVAEKTRQNDVGGGVRIDAYNGNDALVLTERVTGKGYETWIFVADGQLCEEFIAAGAEVDPALIQKIMPMTSMSLKWDEADVLRVSMLTPDNMESSITLGVRSSYEPYLAGGVA